MVLKRPIKVTWYEVDKKTGDVLVTSDGNDRYRLRGFRIKMMDLDNIKVEQPFPTILELNFTATCVGIEYEDYVGPSSTD